MKTQTTFESFINGSINEKTDLYKYKSSGIYDLHFETDADTAKELKKAYGKKAGERTDAKQIDAADYSLKKFRKEIGFGNKDEEYTGVFLPGSYAAAISELGDGPHKGSVKKVKWNQKKYNKWLDDNASDGGADNANDMAQNAKNEPGLIDWVKKQFKGDDPLQRIQWDIEAYTESIVTESVDTETVNFVALYKNKDDKNTITRSSGFNVQSEAIEFLKDIEKNGGDGLVATKDDAVKQHLTTKKEWDTAKKTVGIKESTITEGKSKEDYQGEIDKLRDYNDEIFKTKSKSKSDQERKNLTKLTNNNDAKIQKLTNKLDKFSESVITEGKWSNIMKGVRKGSKSGPWTIVSIENGKVINQELVTIMDAIPAHYEEVKKGFPNAKLSIEDNEGKQVYNESYSVNLENSLIKPQMLREAFRKMGIPYKVTSSADIMNIGEIQIERVDYTEKRDEAVFELLNNLDITGCQLIEESSGETVVDKKDGLVLFDEGVQYPISKFISIAKKSTEGKYELKQNNSFGKGIQLAQFLKKNLKLQFQAKVYRSEWNYGGNMVVRITLKGDDRGEFFSFGSNNSTSSPRYSFGDVFSGVKQKDGTEFESGYGIVHGSFKQISNFKGVMDDILHLFNDYERVNGVPFTTRAAIKIKKVGAKLNAEWRDKVYPKIMKEYGIAQKMASGVSRGIEMRRPTLKSNNKVVHFYHDEPRSLRHPDENPEWSDKLMSKPEYNKYEKAISKIADLCTKFTDKHSISFEWNANR